MCIYYLQKKSIHQFINETYDDGLQKSTLLDNSQIEQLIKNIGIFKFKGYLYAFRPYIKKHSIDDVFKIYYFDKFLTRYVMELTSTIETILKTRLIEICYEKTDNPFFYLLQKYHKYPNFYINESSLKSWKIKNSQISGKESYLHYCLYYKKKYSFKKNKSFYLKEKELCLQNNQNDINYPPFHYFVESATLGLIIYLIKSLKIENYDILRAIGRSFKISNPKTFEPYLERLNEIRNRAAHGERLFNRSFRSVKGIDKFSLLRKSINKHRFVDVYIYLFFMLDKLTKYNSYESFKQEEIFPIFEEFKKDRLIKEISFEINTKLDEKLTDFILKSIGA